MFRFLFILIIGIIMGILFFDVLLQDAAITE